MREKLSSSPLSENSMEMKPSSHIEFSAVGKLDASKAIEFSAVGKINEICDCRCQSFEFVSGQTPWNSVINIIFWGNDIWLLSVLFLKMATWAVTGRKSINILKYKFNLKGNCLFL